MIDIIVSNNSCPHCEAQVRIMEKSFFKDEYRLIEVGSKDFEGYDLREKIDAVPFIIIRNDDGSVRYAEKGKVDGTSLRQLERIGKIVREEKTFNLHQTRLRSASQSMD